MAFYERTHHPWGMHAKYRKYTNAKGAPIALEEMPVPGKLEAQQAAIYRRRMKLYENCFPEWSKAVLSELAPPDPSYHLTQDRGKKTPKS